MNGTKSNQITQQIEINSSKEIILYSQLELNLKFGIEISCLSINNNNNNKLSLTSNTQSIRTYNHTTIQPDSNLNNSIKNQTYHQTNNQTSNLTNNLNDSINVSFLPGEWVVNNKYIKHITIKNITNKIIKLKYNLPSTRCFILAYPEIITLSPGLNKVIEVIFHPNEYKNYVDYIYFYFPDNNGFYLPVYANIETIQLECIEAIDLGYITANQLTTKTITLTNNGQLDTPFNWEMPEPFTIKPSNGIVKINQSIDLELSINPSEALVYVCKSYCNVGEGLQGYIVNPKLALSISAIVKYPFITLSENLLDFGNIVTGSTNKDDIQKDVLLRNLSSVIVEYTITREDSDYDESFVLSVHHGSLQPYEEKVIKVTYIPLAIGRQSIDRYIIQTSSHNKSILTCKGFCVPALVYLSTDELIDRSTNEIMKISYNFNNFLNFRNVEINAITTRVITLYNDSNIQVYYQILNLTTNLSFFVTSNENQGYLLPKSKLSLQIKFSPKNTINYYKRIYVLIDNSYPLFFDVLGTGYNRSNELRPELLNYSHVISYYNRIYLSMNHLSIEQLDSIYNYLTNATSNQSTSNLSIELENYVSNELIGYAFAYKQKDLNSFLYNWDNRKLPMTRSGETSKQLIAPANQLFVNLVYATPYYETILNQIHDSFKVDRKFDSQIDNKITENDLSTVSMINNIDSTSNQIINPNLILINPNLIDFNYIHVNNISIPKQIELFNKTNQEVSVVFDIPTSSDYVITINPKNLLIQPLKSEFFILNFQPLVNNLYYNITIDLYIYPSNQNNFRLVSYATMLPSINLSIKLISHTYSISSINHIEKIQFLNSNIHNNCLYFPISYKNDFIYQTIKLFNSNDFDIMYYLKLRDNNVSNSTKSLVSYSPQKESNNSIISFEVYPTNGIISKSSYSNVLIKFLSNQSNKISNILDVYMCNDQSSDKPNNSLLLYGMSTLPYIYISNNLDTYDKSNHINELSNQTVPIYLPNQQTIFIPPTNIGLTSNITIYITNLTNIPCKYMITIPYDVQNVLSISSSKGFIYGNDVIPVILTYAPLDIMDLTSFITVRTYSISGKTRLIHVIDSNQSNGYIYPPELIQEITCDVVLNSNIGTLVLTPNNVINPVILVNESNNIYITLENISNMNLYYQLHYSTKFSNDTTTYQSKIQPLIKELSNNNVTTRNRDHSLYCQNSFGNINTHTQTQLNFVFYPVDCGVYEFVIYINIVIDSNEDKYIALPVTATILARSAYPTLQFVDIRSDNKIEIVTNQSTNITNQVVNQSTTQLATPLTNQLFTPQTKRLSNQLTTPLSNQLFTPQSKQFPNQLSTQSINQLVSPRSNQPANQPSNQLTNQSSTNIFTQSDVELLWKQFSLTSLNKDLLNPLTDDESKLFSNLSNDKLDQLKVYKFQFTPAVLGSNKQTYLLKITNNGFLTTSFSIHLPNEKQLDLEFWCNNEQINLPTSLLSNHLFDENLSDELVYRYEQKRLLYIINELKCFTIDPLVSVLTPGSSTTITISYSHNSLDYNGLHNLPILFNIKQGKMFYINLLGTTLTNPLAKQLPNQITSYNNMNNKPKDILLWIPTISNDEYIKLLPTPIGLAVSNIPRQRLEIFNISMYDINFNIDIDLLNELNNENYNLPIISIYPTSGIIKSKGSIYFNIYFYPLEVKSYIFTLSIRYYKLDDDNQLNHLLNFNSNQSIKSSSRSMTSLSTNTTNQQRKTKKISAQSNQPIFYEYLILKVEGLGYDPLSNQTNALTTYLSNQPPSKQLLNLPNQLARLSTEYIDFDLVPQHSINHRLFLIYNMSSSNEIEYIVDITSSVLFTEGLLTVTPGQGRIPVGGHVVIDLRLFAQSSPQLFLERVRVTIREIIKTQATKRIGATDKLLEKIKSKKNIPTTIHESVVSRQTISRMNHLSANKQEVSDNQDKNTDNNQLSIDIFNNDLELTNQSYSPTNSQVYSQLNSPLFSSRNQLVTPLGRPESEYQTNRINDTVYSNVVNNLSFRLHGNILPIDYCMKYYHNKTNDNKNTNILNDYIYTKKLKYLNNNVITNQSTNLIKNKNKTILHSIPMNRQSEIRSITSSIMSSIFNDLLSDSLISTYISNVFKYNYQLDRYINPGKSIYISNLSSNYKDSYSDSYNSILNELKYHNITINTTNGSNLINKNKFKSFISSYTGQSQVVERKLSMINDEDIDITMVLQDLSISTINDINKSIAYNQANRKLTNNLTKDTTTKLAEKNITCNQDNDIDKHKQIESIILNDSFFDIASSILNDCMFSLLEELSYNNRDNNDM